MLDTDNIQESPDHMVSVKLPVGLDKDQLFKYLLLIGILASFLILGLQYYSDDLKAFFPTSLTSIVFVLIFFVHQKGYKNTSYHLLLHGINLLLLYMVVIDGNKFYAIYSLYIVGVIFTFIYFTRVKTLILYLIVFVISQLLILYFSAKVEGVGLPTEVFSDGLCLLFANIGVFLMCYFYLINLEKSRLELQVATSELKAQQKELKERSIELSNYMESNIQLENYTHLAAHELRAPLKSIKGFADILMHKTSAKLDVKEKEMFSFISQKTEKMDVLLNDLSDLGRVSQTEIALEYIELDDLFKDILIDRNDLISSRDAIVNFDVKVNTMVGQQSLIKQLFSNLIANALKFVEAGRQPKVTVAVSETKNHILFKVEDNGIGIKPKYRNRIFQIFERLHSDREFKGSGIGLSISKKIVDLHKGTIHVEESLDGGSCFVVRLPKNNL